MVTLAQRLEELRTRQGVSRPALSAALGFPKTAMEKFETGRQTPTQDQQKKLAEYFGVSLSYLRGETDDPVQTENWLNGGDVPDDGPAQPVVSRPGREKPPAAREDGAVFGALLKSPSFQALVRSAVLEALRSPEGQELLSKAIRRELKRN